MIEYTRKKGDVVMIEADKDWLAIISAPTEYEPHCSVSLSDVGSHRVLYLSFRDLQKFQVFLSDVHLKMHALQEEADKQ